MNKVLPGIHEYHDCPVRLETTKIQDLGKEMIKAFRRLRIGLARCEKCEYLESCQIRENFNQTVDQVVSEITEAWQSGGS
jgi:hypothetical protein